MTLKELMAGLTLITISGATLAAEQQNEWISIPESHNTDFRIYCTEGTKTIWGVYPRQGTSDYQVARDIFIKTLPNGRSMLTFKRGFLSADKPTTYIPAVGTNCEISAK